MEPENKTPARNASGITDAGGQNKSVQTYANDMTEVIERNESGLIKKIIQEEEEHEYEKKNLSPESKKNRFFMLGSILFIILASAIVAYLVISREDIGTVDIEMQFTPLIFTDKSAFIEVAGLSKEKIVQSVLNEINAGEIKEGGAEGIYLTENKKIIGFSRFLALIKATVVQTRTGVFGDNFLLGAVNQDSKDLFILLQIQSFTDAFNEMRGWEAKMFYDLHDFFKVPVNSGADYLITKNFVDGIVQNKNARILYDANNKIVLMYIFVDDASIIITNTEEAASELMQRLAASRVKK